MQAHQKEKMNLDGSACFDALDIHRFHIGYWDFKPKKKENN